MLRLHPAIPRFCIPQQTVFGPGSLGALRSITAARVAVVAKHESLFKQIAKQLAAPSVEWVRPSWLGEPTLAELMPALGAIEDFGPDWIVAAGGGSVIDGAKLLWARYEHPGVPFEVRGGVVSLGRLRAKARFAAVPTTAGSGSEMSSAALYTDVATGRKIPCVSVELIPDIAVLDARAMVDVPAVSIGPSALDALAHAIEGYISRFSNPFADPYAVSAVRGIAESLPHSLVGPEVESHRGRLLMAAAQAGVVQNHRVPGVAHAIAHQLSGLGIGHGTATGLLLPHAIRCNAEDPSVSAALARLAESSGVGRSASDLAGLAERLAESTAMPRSLAGVAPRPTGEAEARIVDGAQADVCMRANPIAVSSEVIRQMVGAAWA